MVDTAQSAVPGGFRTVRGSEWVVAAFFVYAGIASAVLPVAPQVRNLVIGLNLAVLAAIGLLIRFDRPQRIALGVARDWLPLGLTLLAYREMGWFALPHQNHALESSWVAWDRLVLRGGGKAAIEAFGAALPSLLEIAYTCVYVLGPFALATLYLYRRRARAERFLFVFVVGVLLCYAQFPFWPSEPPRVVFAGQDAPSFDTIFRRFNWWMLGNCGIHTSVFPSAHVGGAFSAAFGMWRALPEHKWVARFLLAMATLIAIATVYGRYHYLADALAGLAMAALAMALAAALERTLRWLRAARSTWNRSAREFGGLHSVQHTLALLAIAGAAFAGPLRGAVVVSESSALADAVLARYESGVERAAPWSLETIEIDASLPKLEEQGTLRAIRRLSSTGKPEYQVIETAGAGTVRQQVIARYLSADARAAEIPASTTAITEANYKFHYKGVVSDSGRNVFVYLISPRKKREGLIRGELWLDGETGAAVRQSGYLVKNPSIFLKRVYLIRELGVRAGGEIARVTHLSIDVRWMGRAELTIQEHPGDVSSAASAAGVSGR